MDKNAERWWDFAGIFCLAALIMTSASRLAATEWAPDLNRIPAITIIAIVVGLALGYSQFKPWLAFGLGLLYSICLLPWQLVLIIPTSDPWLLRLNSLYARIYWTSVEIIESKPLTDSILFIVSMALFFWILGIFSGYTMTRRGKPWIGTLIAGIALLLFDFYSPTTPRAGFFSGAFAIIVLLMVAQMYFVRNARTWRARGIAIDTDIEMNMGKTALVSGVVLVILAWNIPNFIDIIDPGSARQQKMVETWLQIRRYFEDLTAPLSGPLVVEQEYYGSEIGLGDGAILGDDVVFTVKPAIMDPFGLRYYWKARAYDTYEDDKWLDKATNETKYEPAAMPFPADEWKSRRKFFFEFHPQKNLATIYLPSQPISTTRTINAISGYSSSSPIDILALEADPAVRAGEIYTAEALISAATVRELESAGSEYPDWIKERYLQLPRNFSPKIRQLALDITAGIINPYDQAEAINSWLRREITYTQVLGSPPKGKDPLVWFLFEKKQGFCNYYASSEVLMLRSIGVPARLAVGYASGSLDSSTGFYTIVRRDSHAWVEVYFPTYGWVEFEPTSAQVDIPRLQGSLSNNSLNAGATDTRTNTREWAERYNRLEEFTDMDTDGLEETPEIVKKTIPWYWIVLPGFFLLTVGFLIYRRIDIKKLRTKRTASMAVRFESILRKRGVHVPGWVSLWSLYTRLSPLERIFLRLTWLLRLLKIPTREYFTPAEQIRVLVEILPEVETPATQLLEQYQNAIYSPYPPNFELARQSNRLLTRQLLKIWWDYLTGLRSIQSEFDRGKNW